MYTRRWQRVLIFAYGAVSYLLFLGAFAYVLGFITNLVVPKSIDSGTPGPLWAALVVNMLLLGLFAVQHSGMARPAFKVWLTRFIPQPAERSTYVLLSTLLVCLLFWQWRPIPTVVWEVEHAVGRTALLGVCILGWAMVVYVTFLIDHWDLFGLRQVTMHLLRRPYEPPQFMEPSLYKVVRHPLYLAWLVFFWVTPRMTAGHLLFAAVTTAYILVAVRWEERDLLHYLGDAYRRYRERTPMILPFPRKWLGWLRRRQRPGVSPFPNPRQRS